MSSYSMIHAENTMGMKKHGSKKEALPVENSKKEPQRLTWKSKYEQICATHVTNGTEENDVKEEDETRSNALDGLSGYLSSDSSSGESELNEEVQNFLKEVDVLYEEDRKQQLVNEAIAAQLKAQAQAINKISSSDVTMQQYDQSTAPTVAWQECYDSSTGYTYYWNMETNEVTWDMPPEYQTYMEALKQWQQYQAQGVAALLQARVQQQIQQHHMLLQQAHEQQQNVTKQEVAKAQQGGQKNKKKSEKKSDSEDERIELITSYGPFSEEESSDTEKKALKTAKTKKRKTEDNEQNAKPMGPQLPKNKIRRINRPLQLLKSSLVPYHPENESDTDEQIETSKTSVPEPLPSRVEKDSLNVSNVSSPAQNPTVETKKDDIESIPVKEDDDENRLLDRLKSQTQVLKELGGEIPEEVKSIIVDNNDKEEKKLDESKVRNSLNEESKNLKLKLSARAKKLINKARSTEFLTAPDGLKSVIHKKDEGETETVVEAKKLTRLGMPTSLLSNDNGKNTEVKPREEGSRGGFGFVAAKEDATKIKNERITFVKADTFHLSEEENKETEVQEEEEDDEESDMDVKDVSAVLQDKIRFLSDRKEPVPPVQIWIIQLETLLSAWENKCLKKSYLEDWLNNTRKELETLEGTVAPDGWICEWQREEKRYRYVKSSTGEISWEFPTASGGGEEEMDLSTTPPPLPVTPPPPQISVPSPPSPPDISAPIVTPTSEAPPLPAEVPPLPPLPPPEPPAPPPPLPQSPPPLHSSQPLPPGVDAAELPILPPVTTEFPTILAPVYPPYYQPFPPQPQTNQSLPPPPPAVVDNVPPPPSSHDLSSELDNFYSDLATLEPEQPPLPPVEPPPPPPPVAIPPVDVLDKEKSKKKKKTKLAPGLSLKKKGVSSLVAKWQQVQEDVRRDMKHD
ncbi:formin-binding protein 4 isoform X2 [Halyomorpha halys]|uniref:formin-binding protein 4 isoform X2 n=1 Tax=Halyomorpha halys TaxID=286706 RepID=UPI0006D50BBC|nr:formin-binding protein 4 isoform X2 [Halyomorpha halys]